MNEKDSNQFSNDQEDFLNLNQDVSQTILDLSSFNNANLNHYENSSISDALNVEKKFCVYCKKQFSHQGSYGRHLDLKKGDSLHPLEEINKLRSKVIRRGNGSMKKKSSKIKPKLAIHEKLGKEEKNKIRRKLRDRKIKSKLYSIDWLGGEFGRTTFSESDNFAKMVSLYIPRSKTPKRYPNFETYEVLIKELSGKELLNDDPTLIEKIRQTYQDWTKLSEPEKENLWLYEYNSTLNKTLGNLSLWQLQNFKKILSEKEHGHFQEICEKDDLLKYMDTFDNTNSIDEVNKSKCGASHQSDAGQVIRSRNEYSSLFE